MYSSMLSAVVQGLEVVIIRVEMDVSNGLPSFQIVGSVSTEVKESGERVRTAIKNLGYQLPPRKVVGNLTPGNIRKVGVGFDLSIAISVLAAYEVIPGEKIENVLALGEVGLDGSIYPVKGVLPIVNHARKQGIHDFVLPRENAREGALIEGVHIYGVENLEEVIRHFTKKSLLEEAFISFSVEEEEERNLSLDYNEIQGQEHVKRGIEIAVAGQHNILMIGPPGSGKSMMAKRIPTIQPDLTFEESMELSRIYSVMGLLEAEIPFVTKRPFRNIHHTITKTALVGGGNRVKPGELSLAHRGVLFLDELPEFNKGVLESLRQPLEDKKIQIIRNKGTYEFPTNIMLVAAMNPCPCGNYPDLNRCACTEFEIDRYLGKVSQPLLDRIDICVEVPRVEYQVLKGAKSNVDSKSMKEKVMIARRVQDNRYRGSGIVANEEIPTKLIERYCALNPACEELMRQAYMKMNLTARTYYKILKVARTIADMENVEVIQEAHIREALGYRMIDKKYWGR